MSVYTPVTAPDLDAWLTRYAVGGLAELQPIASGIESTGALVNVGDDWIADPQQLAQYIYFDRCYIHGLDGGQQKRGIAGNGRWIAVVDSHVSNFKRTDYDSQAFSAWNGPGPFKLHNSYFEGAGENVIFPSSRDWRADRRPASSSAC